MTRMKSAAHSNNSVSTTGCPPMSAVTGLGTMIVRTAALMSVRGYSRVRRICPDSGSSTGWNLMYGP